MTTTIGIAVLSLAFGAAMGIYLGHRRARRRLDAGVRSLVTDIERARREHMESLPPAVLGSDEATHLAAPRSAINTLIVELDQERRWLGGAFDKMEEGLVVLDRKGVVHLANPSAVRLLGEQVAAGARMSEVSRQPEILECLRAVSPEAGWVTGEAYESAEGRLLQPQAGSLEDGRTALLLRDVTLEKRVETMRREFVANVSHELKTPLTAIRGYAETLHGSLDDPSLGRFVERILAQCRRLEELLADVMELARLEGDEVMLRSERVPIDLRELLDDVCERVREEHPNSQTSIEVDAQAGTSYRGYRDFLTQLFRNLVDNAVKYSPDGSSVNVRVADHDNAVAVIVSDDGPGIASDHLPHLFERFYRVDPGRDRTSGGTGLGLAIVKHAARAHGGSVMVQSRLGFGTKFTVHLPR